MEKVELDMLVEKINEIKTDNTREHDEIKHEISCLPCKEHSNRLTKLETINSERKKRTEKSSDDLVTKRVMYIFGGIIAGVVLLLKALPEIIKAISQMGGQ